MGGRYSASRRVAAGPRITKSNLRLPQGPQRAGANAPAGSLRAWRNGYRARYPANLPDYPAVSRTVGDVVRPRCWAWQSGPLFASLTFTQRPVNTMSVCARPCLRGGALKEWRPISRPKLACPPPHGVSSARSFRHGVQSRRRPDCRSPRRPRTRPQKTAGLQPLVPVSSASVDRRAERRPWPFC